LPEIDSSHQQEKKYQIKKVRKTFVEKTNINKDEIHQQESSFLNESKLEIPERCRPNINNTLQHQAESLLPFYTFNELAQHNDSTDAWICIFSHIYDITSLINKIQGTSAYQQLIDYAGQDISSWFDEQTHELRRRIDPQTNESVLLIKNLSIVETLDLQFWKTNDLLIGRLTSHCRSIRLVHNFSPKFPYLLEVAEEETIGQIARKFLKYNSHIFSYIWRYNNQILDFNKTLTENGISNEEFFHDKYGWQSDNENCPTILLYFSDDLTIA
jgi:cytochrome b involved in lipid metabolism